jgi:DNA polymerase I
MPKTLYLIDGHYQIYRAFYGLPQQLTSPAGEPTGATHGFCAMLFALIRTRKPDYLAMTMDVSDKTVFRCDIDPQYKANREPPPEELSIQADRIVQIIQSMSIPLLRLSGYEADDIMATIPEMLHEDDIEIFLVSRDKDLHQLLSDRVRLFDPTKSEVLDPASLLETKGYTPEQAVEIQTLVGDSTDNIPGVPGIGPKTAVKLINKYATAEAVLEHADELTPKMKERVKAYAEQLPKTRKLVTLRRDTPIEFALDACNVKNFDTTTPSKIFDELGLTRLIDSLAALNGDDAEKPNTTSIQPATPNSNTGEFDYRLIDSPNALKGLAVVLATQKCFAFDTETTGLNPVSSLLVGISISWEAGVAYYIPVRASMGDVLPIEIIAEHLGPIFKNPGIGKIGQNLKYDVVVLRQAGLDVAGLAFDTMLASFLLDPMQRSHSLDALSKNLLGHEMIPITDLIGKGKNQTTMDNLDTKQVCEYAAEDADFTWRLYELLAPQMSGSDVESLFNDIEMPLVEVLAEMEHNGIALDSSLLSDLGQKMGSRLVELTEEVHKSAGRPFNIDSPKQLGEILFDELGFTPVRKTKTGRSTDADTLATLATQGDNPVPKLVLEYRELSKLKNTYIDTLPTMVCKRTGRVHASFNQTGAVTGRLSSSDPNLQNIPIRTETGKRIREAFIAGDSNNVLLAADYSQIELRLLAHFCKDPALLDAFNSGQDIHRTVAAQVNGVELDEVTGEQRSAAKAVNFGIIYGQSAFGLSRSIGIPVGEAKSFIDMYFMRYPGIRLFIDQCVDDAKRTGFAQTILGRKRPIPELQSRNKQQASFGQRIAVNTVVQGSAADLIKRAMIDIHKELGSGDHAARLLVQVHDELVFELPEKEVERESDMIRDKMENAFQLAVPLVVDIAWGTNWATAK